MTIYILCVVLGFLHIVWLVILISYLVDKNRTAMKRIEFLEKELMLSKQLLSG